MRNIKASVHYVTKFYIIFFKNVNEDIKTRCPLCISDKRNLVLDIFIKNFFMRDALMKRVRKAIIPAAGLGTRFLPATKAMPKEMLPIVDNQRIKVV
jgi:hypothetical protein